MGISLPILSSKSQPETEPKALIDENFHSASTRIGVGSYVHIGLAEHFVSRHNRSFALLMWELSQYLPLFH